MLGPHQGDSHIQGSRCSVRGLMEAKVSREELRDMIKGLSRTSL